MSTFKRRIARKKHLCECGRAIEPGEAYLLHTAFPGDVFDTICQLRECGQCAVRYDRTYELDPPTDQAYRLGVV